MWNRFHIENEQYILRRGKIMRFMKKAAFVATAVLMAGSAVAFASCGDAEAEDTADTKKVLMWINKTLEQAEGGVYKSLAEAFNKADFKTQDGRHIEVVLRSQTDAETLENTLQTAKASGNRFPDVLAVDAPKIAKYQKDNWIRDISEFLTPQEKADYMDSVIEQATIGGKLYALSAMETPTALFYNKEIVTQEVLTRAGVGSYATPQNPWTWDQLAAVLGEINGSAAKIDMTYGFGGNAGNFYFYAPLVDSVGGTICDATTGKLSGHLDSAEAVNAFKSLGKVNQYRYQGSSQYAIVTGEAAFVMHGPWLLNNIVSSQYNGDLDKIGAMPMPVVVKTDGTTRGNVVSGCGSWCLGVSPDTKDAYASAQVVKYFTSAEASLKYFEAIGTFPTHKSSYEDENVNEDLQSGAYKQVSDLMAFASPRPVSVYSGEYELAFKDIIDYIRTNNNLDNIQAKISEIASTHDTYIR